MWNEQRGLWLPQPYSNKQFAAYRFFLSFHLFIFLSFYSFLFLLLFFFFFFLHARRLLPNNGALLSITLWYLFSGTSTVSERLNNLSVGLEDEGSICDSGIHMVRFVQDKKPKWGQWRWLVERGARLCNASCLGQSLSESQPLKIFVLKKHVLKYYGEGPTLCFRIKVRSQLLSLDWIIIIVTCSQNWYINNQHK